MTQTQKKHQRSGLLTMAEGIPPYPLGADSATEAREVQSSPSQRTVKTGSSMTNSIGNTLPHTLSGSAESPKIAAVMFRIAVLALLAAGMVRRGRDRTSGNITILLPSTLWNDDLRLAESETK